MQSFQVGNYRIQITEKTDFDWERKYYPGLPPFYCCKQIHYHQIHQWDSNRDNNTEGDGIYSNAKGIRLKVGTSDCNSLIIMGEERFGIVHAGRRGLQQGIIQSMIYTLQKKGETSFTIFLGPSNRKCCYEVGREFTAWCDPSFLIPKENDKFYFDMSGMIQKILAPFPCKEFVIHPECTQCGEHFFSYRRGDGINNLILVSKQ